VTVIGYSNSSDKADVNGKVSKQRADAVASELVKNGIAKTRIAIEGRGAEKPYVADEKAEGYDLNQRIDIELSRE